MACRLSSVPGLDSVQTTARHLDNVFIPALGQWGPGIEVRAALSERITTGALPPQTSRGQLLRRRPHRPFSLRVAESLPIAPWTGLQRWQSQQHNIRGRTWIKVHLEDEKLIQSGCTALTAGGFVNLVLWRLGLSLGFCCCCLLLSVLCFALIPRPAGDTLFRPKGQSVSLRTFNHGLGVVTVQQNVF